MYRPPPPLRKNLRNPYELLITSYPSCPTTEPQKSGGSQGHVNFDQKTSGFSLMRSCGKILTTFSTKTYAYPLPPPQFKEFLAIFEYDSKILEASTKFQFYEMLVV